MRYRKPLLLGLLALVPATAPAQTTPTEGLRENPSGVHALMNARIVIAPGNVLENGGLVIRDGVIEAVGARITPPADARVWDLQGQTLYPGFIDPHSDVGMREPPPENGEPRGPIYWNPQVRPQFDAGSELAEDEDRIGELRAQGITAAMAVPQLGIVRGRTALVSMRNGPATDRVLRQNVAQSVSFTRSNALGPGYPSSAMGVMALLRQALHDADWYLRAHAAYERNPQGLRRPETNLALAALGGTVQARQPFLFEARNEHEYMRAQQLTREFGLQAWIRGSGDEYRILDVVGNAGLPLILPVGFPGTPNVRMHEASLNVSLAELRHWYLAPENPARLAAAGVEFAFTADGLERKRDFLPNVRKAVEHGLAPDVALSALTTRPARLLGIERTHGTLERGKVANVVVVAGDLFDPDAEIRDVWVDGRRYEINAPPPVDARGEWLVASTGQPSIQGRLNLTGTNDRLQGTLEIGGQSVRLASAALRPDAGRLRLTFRGEALGMDGVVRLSGSISGDEVHGWGELPDGSLLNWRGERVQPYVQANGASASSGGGAAPARRAATRLALPDIRPAIDYGRERMPDQPEHVLVRNATIWTMGPLGTMENADLLVRRGQVVDVGRGLQAPRDAVVIDATGKHVSPGIIDAHLHAGIFGVNEGGGAIVPEVRIGDVLNINNPWMYRQLAGGLTSAHLMHGSANPIGGQNQMIKLRWGGLPEELAFDGAPRTVKFALGENVKRRTGRYPDTRMGTEQIIRDHFQAALEYKARWDEWERGGRRGIPPRRDLRMDALVDIINEDILIQAHSYRQDEILMLMRVAEEFGTRIKAFHHGVEAYKVAPELAAHGAGAVVWTDWSSFKIEAYDATVFNARVLTEAGVVTSLHSDNSQLATRMHWEAAKMLRTGMSEVDALALVTSNTAKLLGVDDRIGSLEPGKDADFVIWNASPLSTTTLAEQTWIDGRKFFDLEEDRRLRQQVERERAQLIQLILEN